MTCELPVFEFLNKVKEMSQREKIGIIIQGERIVASVKNGESFFTIPKRADKIDPILSMAVEASKTNISQTGFKQV